MIVFPPVGNKGRKEKEGSRGDLQSDSLDFRIGQSWGGGRLFAVNPFQFRSSPRMLVALIGYRLKELERSSANGIYKSRYHSFIRYIYKLYGRMKGWKAREKKKTTVKR